MKLTLQSFLLFLRKLVSFFHKRWDQSTRGLWYIFAFLRSRFSSRYLKKRDETRRNIEPRPIKPPNTAIHARSIEPRPTVPPTTVICASRFPPPLSPIAGGDTPIASPVPVSIQVRQATILNPQDPLYETHENNSTDHLGVDGYFLEESGSISRSPNSAGHLGEPESIHVILPPHREYFTSNSPVIPSRATSRPPSQYSYRPPQHGGHRPPSQYSHHPPSEYSYRSPRNLDGAEAAARGYLHGPPSTRPSSPAPSVRPPSIAGSVTSQVYRASRPTTRVPRPSPMRNTSRIRRRPPTPASVRQSVHEAPPEFPELPQPGSRTSGSIHRDRPSTTTGPGPVLPPPESEGRLRPMVGIDRYERHMAVVVDDVPHHHVAPPVTTQFVR